MELNGRASIRAVLGRKSQRCGSMRLVTHACPRVRHVIPQMFSRLKEIDDFHRL